MLRANLLSSHSGAGSHNGYKREMRNLAKQLEKSLEACEKKREERLRHVEIIYEAEMKAAKDNLQVMFFNLYGAIVLRLCFL